MRDGRRGEIAAGFTTGPSADGIATLVRRLARYGLPGDTPAAIERPDGRLADLLLEAGHPAAPVSPERDQDPGGKARCCPGPGPTPAMPR